MAYAVANKKVVSSIVSVELTLTVDEARTLRTILRNVSGSVSGSRRRHADSVLMALQGAGVGYYADSSADDEILTGTLFFKAKSMDAPVVGEEA
jgi:hypothetical protein